MRRFREAPGTLGKKAKLFKNPVGMAFLQKLETGAVVSLIEEAGTRWEVAAPMAPSAS